jgi:hypothetical protein
MKSSHSATPIFSPLVEAVVVAGVDAAAGLLLAAGADSRFVDMSDL